MNGVGGVGGKPGCTMGEKGLAVGGGGELSESSVAKTLSWKWGARRCASCYFHAWQCLCGERVGYSREIAAPRQVWGRRGVLRPPTQKSSPLSSSFLLAP